MKNDKNNNFIVCIECCYSTYIYIYNTSDFSYCLSKYFADVNSEGVKTCVEENKLNIMNIIIGLYGYSLYYKYNINYESILSSININLKLFQYTLTLEYFKEMKDIVFLNIEKGIFKFIRISYEFEFQNIFNITDKIDINTCGNPTRINLFYSQKIEKYCIFTNFNNSNCKNIVCLNDIDSPKLIDFTF